METKIERHCCHCNGTGWNPDYFGWKCGFCKGSGKDCDKPIPMYLGEPVREDWELDDYLLAAMCFAVAIMMAFILAQFQNGML